MAIKPVEVVIKAKDQASSVLDGIGGKLTAVAATVATYFGFSAFAGAIRGAAEFQAAMSRVEAATGATKAEMALLKQAAQDAGASTKYTSAEAAAALETLAKAGLNAKDAIATLPAVLNLAQAGDIELAQSSEYLTKIVMGMGLAFTESGRVADVLAMGANATNTSVVGLSQALSYAAPVAKTLGLSLESTVAIIGKFADAGIDASRAGTALNAIMSQFSDPASKFRQELGAAGIVTGNFEEAIHQLAAAGPAGQKAILAVGLEAGPALRALLGQGMGALDDLTNKLKNAGGSAAETAAVMQNNLNGSLSGLASAWDTVKNVLGTPVLTVLKDGVDKLTGALQSAVGDGTIQKFGDAIAVTFEAALKWTREFLSDFDFKTVVADLRAFADRSGEVFKEVGENATIAAAAARTAYGVMSAGANTVLGIVYLVGESFAGVASNIQFGVALIMDGFAKVTFGSVSARFKEAATEIRISAEATGAVSEAMSAKSTAAFERAAGGAETARAGFAAMTGEVKATGQASAQTDAAVKALALSTVDAGNKATESGTKQKAAADLARGSVAELKKEYEAALAAGNVQLALEKLSAMSAALKDTASQAKVTAADIDAAFTRMGITSTAELVKMRDAAQRDYKMITEAGTSSARDKTEAFRVYAEKAIAANNGVATEALKAEAGMRELAIQTDSTGRSIVSAMGGGKQAVSELGDQVRLTTKELEEQAAQIDAINAKYGQSKADRDAKYSKVGGDPKKTSDGFDKNADGSAKGTFTNTLPVDVAFAVNAKSAAGKLTTADLADAQAGFEQARKAKADLDALMKLAPGSVSAANIQSTNALFIASKLALDRVEAMTKSQINTRPKLAAAAATPAPAAPTGQTPAPVPAKSTRQVLIDRANQAGVPVAEQSGDDESLVTAIQLAIKKQAGPGQTPLTAAEVASGVGRRPEATSGQSQTINITINGKSTPVNVASPDDAAALTSIIEQLANAAGRS